MMFETDSFDFPVARPIEEVYEYLIEPANYTEWAYTSDGRIQHLTEQDWAVETSIGPRIIRFARRNAFGVLDHQVMRDRNSAPHPVGMRVVPCGAGKQVIYTRFRPPSIAALQWASTMEWVRSDLLALQSQLETRGKLAPMPASSTVSLSIRRPVDEVYAFLFDPANLVHWVFGGDQGLRQLSEREWAVETAVGPRVMRYSGRNEAGILDYWSTAEGTSPHLMPMRVFANGEGTELTQTFHQRPEHSIAQWQSTIEWCMADLYAMKSVLET